MSKAITVDVTQDDIDKGEQAESESCPIARAVNRMPGEGAAIVGTHDIYGRGWDAVLPQSARYFIYKFDNGYRVEPFSFEIKPATRKAAGQ